MDCPIPVVTDVFRKQQPRVVVSDEICRYSGVRRSSCYDPGSERRLGSPIAEPLRPCRCNSPHQVPVAPVRRPPRIKFPEARCLACARAAMLVRRFGELTPFEIARRGAAGGSVPCNASTCFRRSPRDQNPVWCSPDTVRSAGSSRLPVDSPARSRA